MSFINLSNINPALLPQNFGGDFHFEKVNTYSGRRRHYRIRCSQTLWGEYAVERSWSAHPIKNPATRTAYFSVETEALEFLRRAVALKFRRGYLPSGLTANTAFLFEAASA